MAARTVNTMPDGSCEPFSFPEGAESYIDIPLSTLA
ncbi:hypothetical protein FHR34_007758 [Kitasatospora kifunensis]|uniref:Uncharacterized protein n=1 Tax=Kitasatospora kifunensis TaxID=58351 RepID=A0A7W7RC34_KITKI|nr:hypothetical protein [Kitasatospora kifunensis]